MGKNKKSDSFSENDEPLKSENNIEEKSTISETVPDSDSEDAVIEDIIDSPESEIEALKNLLQQKDEEIQKEKKDYLFLMADFDNFRKRTVKEKGELIKTGSENVLKSLLPVIDDFERGLEAMKTAQDTDAVKEGMELVYNKFLKFLDQNGVKAMDTNGSDFDPDKHEALTTMPVDDDQKNKIIDTVTKGYTLNDKVIRHAKVVVGN